MNKPSKIEGIVPPQSVHTKQLPAGDFSPGPMSFNKKKAGANGGDLRPYGFKPSEKWGSL